MGILERIKKKFETTFHKANLSDACTALNPEKVKDLLEHAQQVTDRAKTATIFANSIDALGDAGKNSVLRSKRLMPPWRRASKSQEMSAQHVRSMRR